MMDDHDSVGEDDDHDDHSICKAYVKGFFLVHHFKFSTFGTNKWPESSLEGTARRPRRMIKNRESATAAGSRRRRNRRNLSQGVKEDTIQLSDLMGREGPCFHCGIEPSGTSFFNMALGSRIMALNILEAGSELWISL